MREDPALETHALTKSFGDRMAVSGVDLRVDEGSVYGLLGRNGAGKTTLLRMVLGLLAPDSGSIEVFGEHAAAGDIAARDAVAGFVEEPRFYPYLSARRNLELLARLDGIQAAVTPDAALRLVDLADRSGDKVGGFSTGMRQRLGLAAALLRSPRLLVLDEPTIGLDPASALTVRTTLRSLAERGVAVLLSSHNMAEVAEICDRVLIIHEGSMVWDGTQADLQAAAPAPAWRVWTSDDARAAAVATGSPVRLEVGGRPAAPLTVHGGDEQRDAFVLELAAAGVAVRRLEPDVPPLEALFAVLTGGVDGNVVPERVLVGGVA
ncbi:ABC transporter ATP-binding protein [Rugosimonospora africana]|uniref:ABC transporter n=1 Tax=Rugosimonospora africana TaxID=556532 RepID=A0A8J3VQT4_9ACTN|nr:ABC transporter ATP-binding protein [Rugosimonospora africana]GIH15444.1 ABC transporter [Rugosimonospora africana]